MSAATEAALARIRGDVPERNHNARTISALTSNPGCRRRRTSHRCARSAVPAG